MGEDTKAEKSPESFSEQERLALLENFVQQGLDLIKGGKYEEAIGFYEDEKMAERLGFDFQKDTTNIMVRRPIKPGEEGNCFTELRFQCFFKTPSHERGEIVLSRLVLLKFLAGKKAAKREWVSQELYHGIALVYAEEWLHGGQFLNGNRGLSLEMRGRNLSYNFLEDYAHKDIFSYFKQHEVPLTEMYLPNSGRK